MLGRALVRDSNREGMGEGEEEGTGEEGTGRAGGARRVPRRRRWRGVRRGVRLELVGGGKVCFFLLAFFSLPFLSCAAQVRRRAVGPVLSRDKSLKTPLLTSCFLPSFLPLLSHFRQNST